jgi:hypothetical protein
MMLLEILIKIKKITVDCMPNRGMRIVPVIMVPTEAPHKSAARHLAAGPCSSPMIPVTMGN